MRDKLKDLFKKIEYTPFPEMTMKSNLANQFTDYALNEIIDAMMGNGITILPCKPGDVVYLTPRYNGKPTGAIVIDKVQMIGVTSRGVYITTINNRDFHVLGYGVYLSNEEAMKAIKKESEAK